MTTTLSLAPTAHASSAGVLRAAIYCRISYDQAGLRAGVDRQRTECLELAAAHGLSVVAVYDLDFDKSAYSRKPRPDFERLMRDARAGAFDVIVTWAADRLYRQPRDLERIVDELDRMPIHTVTSGDVDLSNPGGRLHARTLGNVSAHESEQKAARVKAVNRQRINSGRMTTGRRAFGWRWADPCPGGSECLHHGPDGEPTCAPGQTDRPRAASRRGLVPDEREGPAVAHVFRMVADGGSVRSAARWLIENGFGGVRGSQADTSALVRGILRTPRNAGLVALKGVVTGESADGLRIVDVETFNRVQAILSDPARRTSPGRPAGTLLSNIARCDRCGAPMNASRKGDARGRFPVYICGASKHLARRRELVDDRLVDIVAAVIGESAERLREYASPVHDADPAAAEAERLRARLAEYDALDAAEQIDPADYATAKRHIRTRLDEIAVRAARIAGRPALAALLATPEPVAVWREMATAADPDPARAVLRELLDRVVIQAPAVRGRPTDTDFRIEGGWFDPLGS